MQHTASFKEASGDMSFKPSASTPKNAFITLQAQRQVPQLLLPSLESATSSSDVRI